jgi:hypothetical protein
MDCAHWPWCDLPQEFGNWFTVYTRFWRCAQKGAWERIFKGLSDDPDLEYVVIDATYNSRACTHGPAVGVLPPFPIGRRQPLSPGVRRSEAFGS